LIVSFATGTFFSKKITVGVDTEADACTVKATRNKDVNFIAFPKLGVSQ
jgi:hypothetical protein